MTDSDSCAPTLIGCVSQGDWLAVGIAVGTLFATCAVLIASHRYLLDQSTRRGEDPGPNRALRKEHITVPILAAMAVIAATIGAVIGGRVWATIGCVAAVEVWIVAVVAYNDWPRVKSRLGAARGTESDQTR